MRTLVLTGCDEKFRGIGELTSPMMEDYAQCHGFDFRNLQSGPGSTATTESLLHPSWWKMYFMVKHLGNPWQRVIWFDADIVITNPNITPPGVSGYHCSLDWGRDAIFHWQLSNCCFTAFPDCIDMIRWVIDNRSNYSCEFHEQNHMREAARGQFKDVITVHPRRVFNAVPIEVHESAVEPWQPGDWVAHCTMLALPERIALVKKMKEHLCSQSA